MTSSRRRVRPLLGTYVEISLRGEGGPRSLDARITGAFSAVEEIDRLMSYHRPDSDLSRLNRARPGEWVPVHRHTARVLGMSNAFFHASGGAFDIRCGAALAGWGLLPPVGPRRAARPRGNRPSVELRGRRARKTGPWVLDLGGIAKGYAVDRAAAEVRRGKPGRRFSGVVNAGGDLRAWGPDAVSITARIDGGAASWSRSLTSGPTAAATSSVRTFPAPSRKGPASHHVDVRRGKPLCRPGTVTVFARRCFVADALSKVVLLARPEIAARCLSAHRAKALVFAPDGRLRGALE